MLVKKRKYFQVIGLCLCLLAICITGCDDKHTYLQHQTSLSIDAAPWSVEFNALPPHIDKYPYELTTITPGHIDSLIEFASQLGVKWVRLSINWSNIVDTSGTYHWEQIDRIIDGLTSKRINIFLCINGGHKLYTRSQAPNTPERIESWKIFTKSLILRYRDKINHWELWNEPNTVWFWKPRPNATEYIELMKAFYELIKEFDPQAKIIGGSLARLDMEFADSLLRAGIGNYIDAISFHPYNEIPEATLRPIKVSVKTPLWYSEVDNPVSRLRERLDAINPAISIWQDECGYPSQDNGSGWMGNGPWSPTIQAKWLLRRMLVDLSYNADVINYFCLAEYTTGRNNILNSKGLLTLNQLKMKPAYRAYQNLITVLNDNLKAVNTNRYQTEIQDEGAFYNINVKNIQFVEIQNEKGHRFLAYWIVWRMQDNVNEAIISIKTEKIFSQPVLINLLSGEISKIEVQEKGNSQYLQRLPLADFPYIITDKNN
ncbi:cellulase family glycosylhydrolase [candidate division KSB1 bacterium]|nr:cellulase family glycosylhydrolase [candidate division KSB1 bacterium]